MIGFVHNIGLPETLLVVVIAILVFGKRLPEVAVRGAVQVQKLRRAMADLRRETGIDAEIRAAHRAVENAVSRDVLSSTSVSLPPAAAPPAVPAEDSESEESGTADSKPSDSKPPDSKPGE